MIKRSSTQPAPVLGLAAGILAVSTASILIRFAQQEAPSLVIAAYRMGIASLFLAIPGLVGQREEIRRIRLKEWGLLFLSGLFLAVHFAVWITSLEYTSVASSVVLVTTTPIWVALFSPIFLKEKLKRGVIWGLLVALTGSVVVGLSHNCSVGSAGLICADMGALFEGKAILGNALALMGALCASGYMMAGRKIRSSLSLSSYVFLVYTISAILLFIAVGIRGYPLTGYPAATYGWFLALGVIPQLLGHTLFNWALKYVSAALVSVALLGEPVGTIILAFFLLKESPSILELAGGALILTGIYYTSRQEARARAMDQVSSSPDRA